MALSRASSSWKFDGARTSSAAAATHVPAAVVFAVLALAVLFLQLSAGAYHVERGSYSDEAAHFLNGLVLRDYLTNAVGESPLAFAEEYYLSYPKIAPGVWPPFFHLLLGAFLLPSWSPQPAALVLVGLITVFAAWRLITLVSQFAPPLAAVVIGGLFLMTPIVIELSSAIMVDLVVAALMIESAYWLAKYFATERLLHAVLFGLAAAGACMTKGNGVAAVLTPLVLLLLTRQFSLLRRSGLYVAAALVIVLAVPALVWSYRFGLTIDDFGPLDWTGLVARVQFYAGYLTQQLGWPAVSLSLIGLGAELLRKPTADRQPPVAKAVAALALAGMLFYLLTPYRYFGGRYAVILVGPLLGMIPSGIAVLSAVAPQPRVLAIALYVLVACSPVLWPPPEVVRVPLGYRAITDFLETRHSLAGQRILIVSDEHGEGAFVAEVASRQPSPAPTLIRASKMLSSGDWVGTDHRLTYPSPDAVARAIEDMHIGYVLLDASSGDADPPFWRAARDQMAQAIAASPDAYEEVFQAGPAIGAKRTVTVYHVRRQSPGRPKPVRIDLTNWVGVVLER